MIIFTTKAYNAAPTLPRAIESILNQTYGEFRYHLCDNGSTDNTGAIIRDYARRDSRIVPFYNARNMAWTADSEKYVLNMARHLADDDWLSVLDADDDYAPDFLEKMTLFARMHDLDYVACRSNHIEEPAGRECNEVTLERDIIIAGDDFGRLFPDYFRFMGARWGKLQKGSLFRRIDFAAFDAWLEQLTLSHRSDTAAMLYYLRYSERAGVLAQLLHNYHLYPSGHSAQNLAAKRNDNLKMPAIYREFLTLKTGQVSAANEKYIDEVFTKSQRVLQLLGAFHGKK